MDVRDCLFACLLTAIVTFIATCGIVMDMRVKDCETANQFRVGDKVFTCEVKK